MHYEPNRVLDEWITATAQVMASSFEALRRKTPLHAQIDAAGWSFRPRFASKYCAAQPPADICPAPVTLPGLDALVAFVWDRRPPSPKVRQPLPQIEVRRRVAGWQVGDRCRIEPKIASEADFWFSLRGEMVLSRITHSITV
jgi:hypothetical protein